MAGPTRGVQIGFSVAQQLSVKLTDDQLVSLRKSIEGGEGWWEAETPDGAVALDARQIVFLRVDSADRGIGFGSS